MDSEDSDLPLESLPKDNNRDSKSAAHNISLFDQLIFPQEEAFEHQSPIIFLKVEHNEPEAMIPECKIEEETPPSYKSAIIVPNRAIKESPNVASLKWQIQCKCSKTSCDKQYCPCHKNNQICGNKCKCKNCFNGGPVIRNAKTILKVTMNPFWSFTDIEDQ